MTRVVVRALFWVAVAACCAVVYVAVVTALAEVVGAGQ